MSKIMEDHDSNFNFYTEDESKAAEMGKGKSRIRGRRTLVDISNMPRGFAGSYLDHKSGPSSDALRKYIEQLQKEKTALMKRLEERNKIIELSGTKMQQLRVTLEKVNQQNLQLAQSNSQMLAELHSVQERQKVLNHELGCKNALIIAKNLELEGKDKTRMCEANDSYHNKVTEPAETEVCTVAAQGDDDKHYTNSLVLNKNIQDNDKAKSKRLQTRRQSAKFKLDEPKPTQDSLKMNNIDDASPCPLPVDDHDDGKMEVNEGDSNSFKDCNKPQEHRNTSLSRPVREAAKKVNSYKEINVNVKMRRE